MKTSQPIPSTCQSILGIRLEFNFSTMSYWTTTDGHENRAPIRIVIWSNTGRAQRYSPYFPIMNLVPFTRSESLALPSMLRYLLTNNERKTCRHLNVVHWVQHTHSHGTLFSTRCNQPREKTRIIYVLTYFAISFRRRRKRKESSTAAHLYTHKIIQETYEKFFGRKKCNEFWRLLNL